MNASLAPNSDLVPTLLELDLHLSATFLERFGGEGRNRTATFAPPEKRKFLTDTQIIEQASDIKALVFGNPILQYPFTIQLYPSSSLPLSNYWSFYWRWNSANRQLLRERQPPRIKRLPR